MHVKTNDKPNECRRHKQFTYKLTCQYIFTEYFITCRENNSKHMQRSHVCISPRLLVPTSLSRQIILSTHKHIMALFLRPLSALRSFVFRCGSLQYIYMTCGSILLLIRKKKYEFKLLELGTTCGEQNTNEMQMEGEKKHRVGPNHANFFVVEHINILLEKKLETKISHRQKIHIILSYKNDTN